MFSYHRQEESLLYPVAKAVQTMANSSLGPRSNQTKSVVAYKSFHLSEPVLCHIDPPSACRQTNTANHFYAATRNLNPYAQQLPTRMGLGIAWHKGMRQQQHKLLLQRCKACSKCWMLDLSVTAERETQLWKPSCDMSEYKWNDAESWERTHEILDGEWWKVEYIPWGLINNDSPLNFCDSSYQI